MNKFLIIAIILVYIKSILGVKYMYGSRLTTNELNQIKNINEANEKILELSDVTKKYDQLIGLSMYLEKSNDNIIISESEIINDINHMLELYQSNKKLETEMSKEYYNECFKRFEYINSLVSTINYNYPEIIENNQVLTVKNSNQKVLFDWENYNKELLLNQNNIQRQIDFLRNIDLYLKIIQSNYYYLIDLEEKISQELKKYDPLIVRNYIDNIREIYFYKRNKFSLE